jgi:hypothetical protein
MPRMDWTKRRLSDVIFVRSDSIDLSMYVFLSYIAASSVFRNYNVSCVPASIAITLGTKRQHHGASLLVLAF